MSPETTVLPPARSMDEEDDATELLSESLFHSCMSSFDDNQKDNTKVAEDEEEAADSSQQHVTIVESRQPQEVTSTEATTSSTAPESIAHSSVAAKVSNVTTSAETNNDSATVDVNTKSSSSNSNSSWSLLSESNERPTIHSITFNRDRTCLIVSTSVGVRIRTLESIHLVNDEDTNNNPSNNNLLTYDVPLLPDGATYSQLLHNTSLLAVIKPSTPRCCYLYNAKNASFPLAALPLSAAVRRVELTRRVLAALTADGRVHVFHMADGGGDLTRQMNDAEGRKALRPNWIQTLNIMHPSDSCRSLTRGMDIFNVGSYFDLSPDEEQPLLVCKSFNGTSGTIRVYDPTIVEEVSIISNKGNSSNVSVGSGTGSSASSWNYYNDVTSPAKKKKRRIHLLSTINAHEHSVTRMVIGTSGSQSFLATTSSKGTTIRLFGLPRGDFLWEFHRGSRSCQFHSLAWSGNADRLVAYGSSGTVHVFSWTKEKDTTVIDEQVEEEEGDFQQVTEESGTQNRNAHHTPSKTPTKPLLSRIGASIRQPKKTTATKPIKHRSFAKLKYKPPTASPISSNKRNSQNQYILLVSLLDRRDGSDTVEKHDDDHNDETLVMCSMDGELRQYTVTDSGQIGLTQLEDVLS